MDTRLAVNDAPRTGVSDVLADVPLVTIAWRILRQESKHIAEAQVQQTAEKDKLLSALADLGDRIHRLRQGPRSRQCGSKAAEQSDDLAPQSQELAEQLEEILTAADITLVAPEGRIYTAELMELIENTAQLPDDKLDRPEVAEVIAPAILYGRRLLKTGKAIIAIPSRPSAADLACQGEIEENNHAGPSGDSSGEETDE